MIALLCANFKTKKAKKIVGVSPSPGSRWYLNIAYSADSVKNLDYIHNSVENWGVIHKWLLRLFDENTSRCIETLVPFGTWHVCYQALEYSEPPIVEMRDHTFNWSKC